MGRLRTLEGSGVALDDDCKGGPQYSSFSSLELTTFVAGEHPN